jgi:hypothetical protein
VRILLGALLEGSVPCRRGGSIRWPLRGRRSPRRLKILGLRANDSRRWSSSRGVPRGPFSRGPSKGCCSLLASTPPASNPMGEARVASGLTTWPSPLVAIGVSAMTISPPGAFSYLVSSKFVCRSPGAAARPTRDPKATPRLSSFPPPLAPNAPHRYPEEPAKR